MTFVRGSKIRAVTRSLSLKRRERDINIFNISMLDVICGALGAFMLVMIILIPFYNRQDNDQSEKVKELQQRLQEAEKKLSKTFLLVYIQWNTKYQDIDLHVIDPAGNEFFYQKRSFPNVDGELSEDSQYGPGTEVWEVRSAATGAYRIFANLYNPHGNPAAPVVRARVFYRDGNFILPEVTLTRVGEKVFIAGLNVDDSGRVTIQGR